MNIRTIAVAAGASAPLILAGSIRAEFTGLSTVAKPNAFGISVLNVYAEYDRPGDFNQGIGGTAASPVFVEVIDGTFYQHPFFSNDTAPNAQLVEAFPSLAFDTFVTIGVKSVDPSSCDFDGGGVGITDFLALLAHKGPCPG